jgi:hypothetical protein
MKLLPSLLAVLALATVSLAARSGGEVKTAASYAVSDETEMAHVERLFSSGTHSLRPAPVIWSSRLEIRWSARWEAAPHYAV